MVTEAWEQFDCYKVLGVHVAATTLEIRKAYYRASREVHPDRGGSHGAQVRVNLAYEVLADPVTRQAHDLFWFRFRAPTVAVREAPVRPPARQSRRRWRRASRWGRSCGASRRCWGTPARRARRPLQVLGRAAGRRARRRRFPRRLRPGRTGRGGGGGGSSPRPPP